MGRRKKEDTGIDPSKATRLTFRLDDETVAMFKTVAAIKRMKLEELGKIAIEDMIRKEQSTIKNWQSNLD